jgi:transposase
VVRWDHLQVHQVAGVTERIQQAGATLGYLPPYSPDLHPIEKCWAKLKELLRAAKARTQEALEQAIAEAIRTITSSDVQGWFASCNYGIQTG